MKYDRWKRIIFGVFCCLFCLTWFASLNVWAAGEHVVQQSDNKREDDEDLTENDRLQFGSITDYQVNLNTTGSIQIHDRYGEGVNYYLYLIAEFSEDGSAYYTSKLSAYAEELSMLPDDLNTAADAEKMAEGLVKIISKHKIAAAVGPLNVNSNGYISFKNLKPGYYLIRTSAKKRSDGKVYSASPILVPVPEGANPEIGSVDYNIRIEAKSELKKKPEEPPKEPPAEPPKPPKKPGKKLPQTGALWWPLPFLFAGGLLLYFLGVFMEKKAQAADRDK